MLIRRLTIVAGLLCGLGTLGCALRDQGSAGKPPASPLALIPVPAELAAVDGEIRLDAETRVALSDPASEELQSIAELWAAPLRRTSGLPLPVAAEKASPETANEVRLVLRPGSGHGEAARQDEPDLFGDESYRLVIDADGVTVTAPAPAGLFYGTQTLNQLLPAAALADGAGVELVLPTVHIADRPRFRYRGMHLDVGRHMFPVEFIKKYVDLLARHKMNTFHWHLTEDQGWRLEIKKYPRLTEVGAFRKETVLEKNRDPYVGDGQPYGGFYTQEEAREVVAYAAERYVRVIPEIEMPGHSQAALAAYPELACTDGPFEVATSWGVFEDIYCPKEATFTFLEDVLTEVMEIFPSPYIHIGGDEAPKKRWRQSAVAQAVIEREGLAGEAELQSWFIRRIEAFLLARGRRLIGWDEILEGGLAPEATVMSWRGMEGGIEAARQGHDVIMTPTSHCYFDYYQADPDIEPLAIGGLTPLAKVYRFEPVPEQLTAEQARHVLGAQGNVWTEYMKTSDYVEYMVFPRLLALAEVVWSPRAARDWNGFRARLGGALKRLDALGVHYRRPADGE